MAKNQRTYTRESKIEAVRLLERIGKSHMEIERDLGIGSSNPSRWKKQSGERGEEAFPGRGRLSPERAVAIFSQQSK
jgi:transposase